MSVRQIWLLGSLIWTFNTVLSAARLDGEIGHNALIAVLCWHIWFHQPTPAQARDAA